MRDSSHAITRSTLHRVGDLDAEQPLRAERERDVVAGRVQIILAVRPRDDLIVLAVFADLLEAAVQIADVGDATDHRLAVELEHQTQHAVGRGMLRADVDEHVLAVEPGLHFGWLGHGDRVAGFIHRERDAARTTLRIQSARRQFDVDRALGRRHAIPPSVRRT